MTAYYNEYESAAVAALKELASDGVIAPGVIDDRSIIEIQPDELEPFTQCHFFAGGGLWSVAARLAGWPDDKPLWTGSCPCQPFSVAGKQQGEDDPRHLWPHFFRLIKARRPPVVVGEQVGSALGYAWFDGVAADLEREDYAARAVDIPACAVDAPHIRNRLYWIAVAQSDEPGERRRGDDRRGEGEGQAEIGACDQSGGSDGRLFRWPGALADADQSGRRWWTPQSLWGAQSRAAAQGNDEGSPVGDAVGARLEGHAGHGEGGAGRPQSHRPVAAPDGGSGFWDDAEWIVCHDGKIRRTKPGLRLLVDGFPGRVDLWRVAGNAIVPQVAAEVLAAFLDCESHGVTFA